jgi:hypothetical protein
VGTKIHRNTIIGELFLIFLLISCAPFIPTPGIPFSTGNLSNIPEGQDVTSDIDTVSDTYSNESTTIEDFHSSSIPPGQMSGSGDTFSVTEYARDDSFSATQGQIVAPNRGLWNDLSDNFTSSFTGWTADVFNVNVTNLKEGDIQNDGSNGDYDLIGPYDNSAGHWQDSSYPYAYRFQAITFQGRSVAYTDLGNHSGQYRYSYLRDTFYVSTPAAGSCTYFYFTFYMHKPDPSPNSRLYLYLYDGHSSYTKYETLAWWISNTGAEDGFWTYVINCTEIGLTNYGSNWRIYFYVYLFSSYTQVVPGTENKFYFDMAMISHETSVNPSEVGLQISDNGNSWNIVDIAGSPKGDGTNTTTDSWSDTLELTFSNSTPIQDYLLFDYTYQINVSRTSYTTSASFDIETGLTANWIIDFTALVISPGDATAGYWFSVDFPNDWFLTGVQHPIGTPRLFGWSWSGGILTIEELIAGAGEWRFLANSPNYVVQVMLQTNSTRYGGTWVNLTSNDYVIEGDYVRIWGHFLDVTSTSYGNVSLVFANGTVWQFNDTSASHPNPSTDILLSAVWQIPHIEHDAASSRWVAQVNWQGNAVGVGPSQVGLDATYFTVVVNTAPINFQTPVTYSVFLQGNSTWVRASFTEADMEPITGGAISKIQFTDLFGFPGEVTMTDEGDGNYSRYFDTGNLEPGNNRKITLSIAKQGYVNRTGIVTFQNLVNPTELTLLRPTTSVFESEIDNATDYRFAYYEDEVAKTEQYNITFDLSDISGMSNRAGYPHMSNGSGWFTGKVHISFSHNASGLTSNWVEDPANPGRYRLDIVSALASASIDDLLVFYVTVTVNDPIAFRRQYMEIRLLVIAFAAELNADQTFQTYPPPTEWLVFNPAEDDYEVNVYWNEPLLLRVYYLNTSATLFYNPALNITGATVKLTGWNGSTLTLYEEGVKTGNYSIVLLTGQNTIGTYDLQITANRTGYAAKSIGMRIHILPRATSLSRIPTSTVFVDTWGDTVAIRLNYTETVTGTPIFITNSSAPWVQISITGYSSYSTQSFANGTYLLILTCDQTESLYSITVTVSRGSSYTSHSFQLSLLIQEIDTNIVPLSYPSDTAWGDNSSFTILFQDASHGVPISGAINDIVCTWMDSIFGTDYWIIDQGSGHYRIILNTTKAPSGWNIFTMNVTIDKDHYVSRTITITVVIRDIYTTLYYLPSDIGPHMDIVSFDIFYTDIDHSLGIANTTGGVRININCSSYSIQNLGNGHYKIYIDTSKLNDFPTPGSYSLLVEVLHQGVPYYQARTINVALLLREIATSLSYDLPSTTPLGENASFLIYYYDIDHASYIAGIIDYINCTLLSGVPVTFNVTVVGVGIYRIWVNTTASFTGPGSFTLNVTINYPGPPYYQGRQILVDLLVSEWRTTITFVGSPDTEVNWSEYLSLSVNYSVQLTGHFINGANVSYSVSTLFGTLVEGVNSYSLILDTSQLEVGTHIIYITATLDDYQPRQLTLTIFIRAVETDIPTFWMEDRDSGTGTLLWNFTTSDFNMVVSENFTLYIYFTTLSGTPINAANINYLYQLGASGLTEVSGHPGLYSATLSTYGLLASETYPITITASKLSHESTNLVLQMTVINIPVEMITETTTVVANIATDFDVAVYLNDTWHNRPVIGASVTASINNIETNQVVTQLTLEAVGNGWYQTTISILQEGSYTITVRLQYVQHESVPLSIYLTVEPTPFQRAMPFFASIIALLGLIILGGYLYYAKIYSIPPQVRAMRKMTKEIGKGKIPSAPTRHFRDKQVELEDIFSDRFQLIGMGVPTAALPIVMLAEERRSEEEAIRDMLDELEGLTPEAKEVLFVRMKDIPPKDRVWFIEDMKTQMAEGRFDYMRTGVVPEEAAEPEEAKPPIEELSPEERAILEKTLSEVLDKLLELDDVGKARLIQSLISMAPEDRERALKDINASITGAPRPEKPKQPEKIRKRKRKTDIEEEDYEDEPDES